MAWLRLNLTCQPPYPDQLQDLLERFGAESVSLLTESTEAVFADGVSTDQYWHLTSVSALFSPDIDVDILLACIRNKLGTENIIECSIESVADENWSQSHNGGSQPIIIGNKICICPSWCNKPSDIAHIIELDPGLAFGMGAHATTLLCLEWLASHDVVARKVIDYGCGSGILGITAAVLGAEKVLSIDIDEKALLATNRNAIKNQVETRINAGLPDDAADVRTDILLANILLKPLLELSIRFKTLVGRGGNIVLSGILASQTDECIAAYQPWFSMFDPVFRNEWVMLSGVRNHQD